jgi:hypothetical protein
VIERPRNLTDLWILVTEKLLQEWLDGLIQGTRIPRERSRSAR